MLEKESMCSNTIVEGKTGTDIVSQLLKVI